MIRIRLIMILILSVSCLGYHPFNKIRTVTIRVIVDQNIRSTPSPDVIKDSILETSNIFENKFRIRFNVIGLDRMDLWPDEQYLNSAVALNRDIAKIVRE